MLSDSERSEFDRAYAQFDWQQWDYLSGGFGSLKQSNPAIPCRPGVYIIRAPSPLGRVRGSSDVVYLGQSGRQGLGPSEGRTGRLLNTRGMTEMRIRNKVEALFPNRHFVIECTFVEKGDPRAVERQLLEAYFQDHCELPPANQQMTSAPKQPVLRPTEQG